jgi:hypothetical protein
MFSLNESQTSLAFVYIFAFSSPIVLRCCGMAKWATVTVVDDSGRRHSLDLQAESTFDAAHQFVVLAKSPVVVPVERPPVPNLETNFEVTVDGKTFKVRGNDFQEWINKRRQEWKGPRGLLFKQRPTLND